MKTLKIFLLILNSFFLDILFAGILQNNVIQILLCLFITLNLIHKTTNFQNICMLFLLSLESLLFYSKFGLDLAILTLIILISEKTRKMFYSKILSVNLLLFFYFLLKTFLINFLFLHNLQIFQLLIEFICCFIISLIFIKILENNTYCAKRRIV